jgi:hypothetical protein
MFLSFQFKTCLLNQILLQSTKILSTNHNNKIHSLHKISFEPKTPVSTVSHSENKEKGVITNIKVKTQVKDPKKVLCNIIDCK